MQNHVGVRQILLHSRPGCRRGSFRNGIRTLAGRAPLQSEHEEDKSVSTSTETAEGSFSECDVREAGDVVEPVSSLSLGLSASHFKAATLLERNYMVLTERCCSSCSSRASLQNCCFSLAANLAFLFLGNFHGRNEGVVRIHCSVYFV